MRNRWVHQMRLANLALGRMTTRYRCHLIVPSSLSIPNTLLTRLMTISTAWVYLPHLSTPTALNLSVKSWRGQSRAEACKKCDLFKGLSGRRIALYIDFKLDEFRFLSNCWSLNNMKHVGVQNPVGCSKSLREFHQCWTSYSNGSCSRNTEAHSDRE